MIDVAIDARHTRRMSLGVRAYVDELLASLPVVAPDLRVAHVGSGENFGWAEQIGLPRAIARSRARIVHYPTTFAPVVRGRPYLVTIHDLIHLRHARLFGRATALHYRWVGGPLARGATRLVMGDERTVLDCERYLGVAAERCRVVPLGYDPGLLAPAEPLARARPFILFAGNRKPHKNLATLLAAFARLPPACALDLLITGPGDPGLAERFSRAQGSVVFTGHLTPGELRRHFRSALAYVHPALSEGFGLPMLEAAVVGTPVIASSTAVPSIVAPYAAAFEPLDVATLRALLDELVRDPAPFRARAAEGAPALRTYTWERFAAATAAVYREVIECSSGHARPGRSSLEP